jgi:hypothetical protein
MATTTAARSSDAAKREEQRSNANYAAVRVVRILILPNKEECARGMERWSKYAAVRVVRIKFNKEECV